MKEKKSLQDEAGKPSWSRQFAMLQTIAVAVTIVVGFVFAGFSNKMAVEFAQWVIMTLTGGAAASTLVARWTAGNAKKENALGQTDVKNP